MQSDRKILIKLNENARSARQERRQERRDTLISRVDNTIARLSSDYGYTLSVSKLCEAAGLSREYMANLKSDEARAPSAEAVQSIEKAIKYFEDFARQLSGIYEGISYENSQ